MPREIKRHSLNFLTILIIVIGTAGLIYFSFTKSLFKQTTTLEKEYSLEVSTTSSDNVPNIIDKEELAQGFIAMRSTDITIPESVTLEEYDKLIASSTLKREYFGDQLEVAPVGPGFLVRGGKVGLEIYLPTLQGVLDDELISQNQALVRVYIDSITDKSGKDILDEESPFEKNSFFQKLKFETFFSNQGDKYYKTERAIHLKGDQLSLIDNIKKISGSVVFNLPISVNKFVLSQDQITSKSSLKAGNTIVTVKDLKEGALYLKIKSSSKTVIYVKGYNQNDEVIATSIITAIDPEDGFEKQSIISFDPSDKINYLEIYAPKEVFSKRFRFAI